MAYFYYQKNPFGRWAPCMSEDRPNHRSPDGAKRTITQVIEIPQDQTTLPLNELVDRYPPTEV